MKIKSISIKLPAKSKYNWLVKQRWGSYMLSVKKPFISKEGSLLTPKIAYWECDGDYLEIDFPENEKFEKWRKSLRKI